MNKSAEGYHMRILRIYNGDGCSVMGASERMKDSFDDQAFRDWADEQQLTVNATDVTPEGGVSGRYVEVRPPLETDTLESLGRLYVDLASRSGCKPENGEVDIDYRPGVVVVDNREELPDPVPPAGEPRAARGNIIASVVL